MSYCADTNILLRWLEPGTLQGDQARRAVHALRAQGEAISITPQNLVEFWNVATRPISANGLGLTPSEANHELIGLEALFPLLPDSAAINAVWRQLVVDQSVSGVQVHDARLAAALQVHGVTHLLTFNTRHFARFGITVVDPATL